MKRLSQSYWTALARPSVFTVFAWLWAAAILIHMSDRLLKPLQPDEMALGLFALVFLLAPSIDALIWLIGMQVISAFVRMPYLENHWLFVLVANAVLLAALGWRYLWIELHDDESRTRAFARVVPLLRVLTIGVYGIAAFHKLNWGFLDPYDSCAVFFYRAMAHAPAFVPLPDVTTEVMAYAVIALVLVIEFSIPILLSLRRTWFFGIVLGVLFHLFASPTMRDFPMVAIALYWLFIPVPVATALIERTERWFAGRTSGRLTPFGALQAGVLLSVTLSFVQVLVPPAAADVLHLVIFRGWSAAVLGLLAVFCYSIIRHREYLVTEARPFTIRPQWLLIVPALFVFNGFMPYLGLKTTTALSMFSNLRTERGVSNHLLLPRWQHFTYQDDLVEIIDTSDTHLQEEYVEKEQLITWFMLRRWVQQQAAGGEQDIAVTYRRGSEVVQTAAAERELQFLTEETWLEKKFLEFRGVDKDGGTRCAW